MLFLAKNGLKLGTKRQIREQGPSSLTFPLEFPCAFPCAGYGGPIFDVTGYFVGSYDFFPGFFRFPLAVPLQKFPC